MTPSAAATRAFAALEHRVFGVAFLVLLVLAAWLTYGIFTKSFTDFRLVTLETSKTGLQLPDNADVKIRGVLVGEVRDTELRQDGTVALTLGIYPESLRTIPAGVTARILPKTLFGEKYVALQVPESGAGSSGGESISAGAVIEESKVAIEVERVLSDLYPLLRTVQPAEVNYTLTALATALEGRGEALGENLVVLEDYLRRANPKIPVLVEDLRRLGAVSEVYRSVVPELANILRNSVTTGNTFVDQEQKLQALFSDVAGFSATSRDFLEQNGDNIIRLSEQGQAQLPLFAKYSSEYPCLLDTMSDWIPRMESAYRGYTLHINLETLPRQPRGYDVRDDPAYADERGPISTAACRAAPGYSQRNLPGDRYAPRLKTGVDYPVGKRTVPGFDVTSGYAGTAPERAVVNSVASAVMGVPADDVPDVATLLLGPIARGTEVSVR